MTTSLHLSAPRLGWTSLPDAPGSYTTQLGGNMIVLVVCSCAGGWQASVEAAEQIHLTTVFSTLSDAQAAAAALAAGLLNEIPRAWPVFNTTRTRPPPRPSARTPRKHTP